MADFQKRLLKNEQLDDLDLSGPELIKTLKSLAITNALFGTHAQIKKAVLQHIRQFPKTQEWHIVDLGCGGGDCMFSLKKFLKNLGYQNIKLTGIDGNANSIAFAKQDQVSNVDFKVVDLSKMNFDLPDCDLVISSHYSYHFNDNDFVKFIDHLKALNVPVVIFSELQRRKLSYRLFKIVRFLLPLSKIARQDGLIAIKRSFTLNEAKTLVNKTKFSNCEVSSKPWFRMLIKLS